MLGPCPDEPKASREKSTGFCVPHGTAQDTTTIDNRMAIVARIAKINSVDEPEGSGCPVGSSRAYLGRTG